MSHGVIHGVVPLVSLGANRRWSTYLCEHDSGVQRRNPQLQQIISIDFLFKRQPPWRGLLGCTPSAAVKPKPDSPLNPDFLISLTESYVAELCVRVCVCIKNNQMKDSVGMRLEEVQGGRRESWSLQEDEGTLQGLSRMWHQHRSESCFPPFTLHLAQEDSESFRWTFSMF